MGESRLLCSLQSILLARIDGRGPEVERSTDGRTHTACRRNIGPWRVVFPAPSALPPLRVFAKPGPRLSLFSQPPAQVQNHCDKMEDAPAEQMAAPEMEMDDGPATPGSSYHGALEEDGPEGDSTLADTTLAESSMQEGAGATAKEDKHGVDHRLDNRVRLEIVRRLLDKYWKPDGIARDLNVSIKTVYRIKNNLIKYGSAVPPREKTLGRPKGLSKEDEDYLLERLTRQPDMNLRQLSSAMKEERNITVSRSTLSRVLTARRGPSATALAMKERKPRKSLHMDAPEDAEHGEQQQQPLPEPMAAQMTAQMAAPPHPQDVNPNIDSSLLDATANNQFSVPDFSPQQLAEFQQQQHFPRMHQSNLPPHTHDDGSVGNSGLIG